jgi:DNA-binding NarL/FixJ family response regulator
MTATHATLQSAMAARRIPHPSVKYLLVLDDYVTFADAIASRLDAEPGVRAFAATTAEQARWVMGGHYFDGLLLDIDLDGHNGLRFAAEVLAAQPDLRIVVVTGGSDVRQLIDAVRLGVYGWVPKDEPIEHLLAVVRGALRGETWIPPRLLTTVLAELKSSRRDVSQSDLLVGKLTRREREVLGFLVMGMSADAIASQLFLSRNTVRTHIQNLIGKLGVHSAVAAVAVARRADLQGPDPIAVDTDENCGQLG